MSDRQVKPTYLGDAVYASFDGYMIGLTVDHHEAPVLIWLEPKVYDALRAYAEQCWRPLPSPPLAAGEMGQGDGK